MTVTHRTQLTTATQRDAWIEVNLSALERNYKKINEIIKTDIMAVVKADAYGHGSTTICPILQSLGTKSFGVATVDEGLALRDAGIKTPILILGATPAWSYQSCLNNKLTITIYSQEQLKQLEEFSKNLDVKIPIQIKIDTGMNRLGISPNEANDVILKITSSKVFNLEGIFSHLSDAKDYNFSKLQKDKFDSVIKNLKKLNIQRHLANSYAAVNYPDFRYDMVRIGIALYGHEFNFLEPLISLKGRITRIHKVEKGEFVSYERTWQADKDSLIATIPIGYADGIDKNLSNNIFAIYNKNQIKQVGNITMDQMMLDISNIKDPKVNDVVTLLGPEINISVWAKILNTISYELLCRLKMRLPRVYTRD